MNIPVFIFQTLLWTVGLTVLMRLPNSFFEKVVFPFKYLYNKFMKIRGRILKELYSCSSVFKKK